jgi:glycerol-1-phosphate dehydrogenase [NAD(P)+]
MMAYLHETDWEHIRETLRKLEAPTTARELGVENHDIVKALEMASKIRPERYTILNKRKLDLDDCEKLAKTTLVI